MDGDKNNLIDAEKEFEISALRKKIKELELENTKLQILLKEINEDANPNMISDTEATCTEQIQKLKENSSKRELTTDEVKRLDLLHKNLKLARGENARVGAKSKVNDMSADELTDLVKGK